MKKILFLSFILFTGLALSAQDRIITTSGDTIVCRIVSVSGNHIVYEHTVGKQRVTGKTIPLENVAEYLRVPVAQSFNERSVPRMPEHPWLLSLSVGGAHLLENVANEAAENDDYKKLDDGFVLNASVHYLIMQYIGFGIQYSFFTSGIKSNRWTKINDFPIYGNDDFRERQYINYIGSSVFFRQFLDNNRKFSLSETLGGGLLFYRDERQSKIFLPDYYYSDIYGQFRHLSQNGLLTYNGFGATFCISAEYKILPYLSVGIGGNFLYGSLIKAGREYKNSYGNTVKITDVKLEKLVNLSRIDYSFVVRIQL